MTKSAETELLSQELGCLSRTSLRVLIGYPVVSTVGGPVSFDVELEDGRVVKRHLDQVRRRDFVPPTSESSNGDLDEFPLPLPSESTEAVDPSSPGQSTSTMPRRSTRTRGPPDRYTP